MFALPDLDEDDVRVLNIVNDEGMVRGSTLMRRAGFKRPNELKKVIIDLMNADLIEVSGNLFDERDIRSAVFSTRPSTQNKVQLALKKVL